ncbi:MAG: UvrD-helicase domain-containing protein [Gemmatimonadetes bacterium]|nr:UvrD-helicase domain-containing protein [Gemmatimonadota bacterium]
MTTPSLPLNEAQRQAVELGDGPTLVLAGAGSGKTRVIAARIAHLVRHRNVRPEQIFAVTFTNKAAAEMRNRIAALLGREPTGLWIGTFHSLSARLLRREAERLGFTSRFTIYDADDQLALLKHLLDDAGYAPKAFPPRVVRALISNAKNRMVPPEELAAEAREPIERVAAEIHLTYNRRLAAQNAMDFDDLLLHPLTLFREHPERLAVYQQRFRCVLVDEFQDTNRAQYLLVRHLSAAHENLCVVGDDDQSIYGWRGAEVRNMLDFERDFPRVTVVRLEENYRSTQMVLDAANGVIAENTDRLGKTLFTSRGGGEPVVVVTAADERDEAEWVAREYRERSATDHYVFADMAVLYRTNAQSRAFEEAFRRAAVPYRVVGSVSFFARREVRDLVAYLRLISNPADDQAFLRAVQVPKRGLGLASIRTLQGVAAQWGRSMLDTAGIADRVSSLRPQAKNAFRAFAKLIQSSSSGIATAAPAAILERLIEATHYDAYLAEEGAEGVDRMENVRELLASAAEWSEEIDPDDPGTPLERFLTSAALTTSDESVDGDPEGVQLMTVHTAKGLEWPVVTIAGMEDGLFPLSRSTEAPGGLAEERRLLYVAITRARDRLYLTWARSRRRGGQFMPGIVSRFIETIPPEVVEERRTSGVFGGDWYRKAARPKHLVYGGTSPEEPPEMESQDAPRYIKGERVRHRSFGSGVIRGLDGTGRDLKVIVEFDDQEVATKHLLITYAGLERDWDPA